MFKDTEKNISGSEPALTTITLLSSKINVLVVGGGRAGFIKAAGFVKRGCHVTVLSPDFCEGFNSLSNFDNLTLIKNRYSEQNITDKHLIIAAVNDNEVLKQIILDCQRNYKLFLNCSEFKRGNFIVPAQAKMKNIHFSVNTTEGNPKIISFLIKIIGDKLAGYDSFVGFASAMRNSMKNLSNKKEILNFVCSEDFYYFYKKGVHKEILEMFYGGEDFDFKNSNKEE